MNKRVWIGAGVALAIFVLASTATAASVRSITKKLGGVAGDTFDLAGTLVTRALQVTGRINNPKGNIQLYDNVEVKGTLAVGGLRVAGRKYYTGTFDTAASGDEVTSYTYPTPCAVAKSQSLHYKKIAVAGLSTASLPNLRVFWKPLTPSPITYSPNYYPNNGDVWQSAGYVVTDGYVYLMYKTTLTSCADAVTPSIMTTGEYKILVN